MIDLEFLSLEYVIVIMAMIILYLLYYVYTKDSQYNRNIHSVATVVEDLNREIFYLKKKLTDTQKNIKDNSRNMSDDEIYQEIERSVYDMIHPISIGLQQVQESVQAIDTKTENRLNSLESGVKQMSIPTSIHANDDEKIISLYKQGVGLETISKELHLSKAEVEFVLKINKIQ